jgi:hypothetical protein
MYIHEFSQSSTTDQELATFCIHNVFLITKRKEKMVNIHEKRDKKANAQKI